MPPASFAFACWQVRARKAAMRGGAVEAELLLSRRGFHPRQRMLEWRSRNPEIAA
jgi:hypothetical protein